MKCGRCQRRVWFFQRRWRVRYTDGSKGLVHLPCILDWMLPKDTEAETTITFGAAKAR